MNKDPNTMTMDEAAEALNAFLNGSMETPTEQQQVVPETVPATEPTAVIPDGEANTAGDVTPQTPDGNTEPTEQTAEPPATEQQPTTTPTGVDPYEARFAKFEEELQRLRSENGRMRKIAAENAMLRRKQREAEVTPEQRAKLADLTDEQTYALGDDVADTFKAKLAEADKMLEEMDQRYQQQQLYIDELKQRDFKVRHEAMMDAVESQYGEAFWKLWETPEFEQWSKEYDPLTGKANGELLMQIDKNADANAAIALLGNFAREVGYVKQTPSVGTTTRTAPTSANVAQRPAASQAHATPPTQSKPKQAWTPEAIDAAFKRADRDPAWAKSKEGTAVFKQIMDLATNGYL